LAVPGKSETMICERCFASVKLGSEFCPECGAPMGDGPAEGSDAAIYPELARANLLRTRGDYKAALEQCRAILRKFPNNVTANQLLGDLCSETGDLEQAKEWYELALDIAPNSAQIRGKLTDVRQKLEAQETAGMVEQLGLPPAKSRNSMVAIGLAVLVIAVGVAAYIVGSKAQSNSEVGPPKMTSVQAPITNSSPEQHPAATTTPTTAAIVGGSADEQSLKQLVAQRSSNGSKLDSIILDPRSGLAVVTFSVGEAEDSRQIAAEIASVVFDNSAITRTITIRAIKGGALSFIADVHRDAYEQTKSDDWKAQNGSDPNALATHILSQEWPASSEAPSSSSGNPDNAGQTSGATGTTGP
jgi:hypothetical protein